MSEYIKLGQKTFAIKRPHFIALTFVRFFNISVTVLFKNTTNDDHTSERSCIVGNTLHLSPLHNIVPVNNN